VKNFFKTDPDGSLRAAETALAQTQDKLRALELERESLLFGEGDYAAAIEKLDKQLEVLRSNADIHAARIVAMTQRQRDHAASRLEQQRIAFIADELKKKRLPRRLAAAVDLDGAPLKDVPDKVAKLVAACDAVYENWPDVMPSASRFNWTRVSLIDALSARRKQRMSAGLVRELAARGPYNFTTAVAELNNELLAELDSATLPENAAA
jgi:chromosome segregation ATPase